MTSLLHTINLCLPLLWKFAIFLLHLRSYQSFMTLFARELLAIPTLQMGREKGVTIINAPWKSYYSLVHLLINKSLQTNFKTQSNNFITNRIFNSDLSNFISDLKWGYVTFCITDEVRVITTKNLICLEILGLSFEIGLLKYVFPREQIKNLSGNSFSYFCL